LPSPEELAWQNIDALLAAAGWNVQSREELNLSAAKGVERLSSDLVTAFPEMKGLSLSNLWRMRSFYLAHSQLPALLAQPAREVEKATENPENLVQAARELLRQAVADFQNGQPPQALLEIPRFHNVVLIEKLKDPALRFWYAAQTTEHGWSRAVLVHQIESELHLRATSKSNNFDLTFPNPQSDFTRELIKDSFNLELLDVRGQARGRVLHAEVHRQSDRRNDRALQRQDLCPLPPKWF